MSPGMYPVSSDMSVKQNQVMRIPCGDVVKGGGPQHPVGTTDAASAEEP